MSEGWLGSYAESGSGRSSRWSTWWERRQKRCEDREHEQEEEQSSLGEGSYQTHRIISGASGHGRFNERDEELERLYRLVRDLEFKARGRHRRRDRKEHAEGSASVGGHYREGSHRSNSHRHRDRSWEYADQDSISLEEWRPRNTAIDAISRALRRAAQSPFSRDIERAPMPSRFTQPPFISYDGKMDLVEHVSHYI